MSDLGDSDRGFLLSFAGIVSAGFAFALIPVDERGLQSVSQAGSGSVSINIVKPKQPDDFFNRPEMVGDSGSHRWR